MKRYLLPCRCGAATPIDSAQAGLQVTCACGAVLDVPTWAALQKLPLAPGSDSGVAASAWGPRQGLRFLGGVVLALGLVLAALAYWRRPMIQVDLSVVRNRGAELTPAESWQEWLYLRQGLSPQRLIESEEYLLAYAQYRRNLTLSLILAGVGVAILAASPLAGNPPRRD